MAVPSTSDVAVEPHEPIATQRERKPLPPFTHALHKDSYPNLSALPVLADTERFSIRRCCVACLPITDRPHF